MSSPLWQHLTTSQWNIPINLIYLTHLVYVSLRDKSMNGRDRQSKRSRKRSVAQRLTPHMINLAFVLSLTEDQWLRVSGMAEFSIITIYFRDMHTRAHYIDLRAVGKCASFLWDFRVVRWDLSVWLWNVFNN